MKISELFSNIVRMMPYGTIYRFKLYGNSMNPTFKSGDILMAEKICEDCYKEGDITVFESDGMVIAHRIITINGDNVLTKGDALSLADPPIKKKNLLGKVVQ